MKNKVLLMFVCTVLCSCSTELDRHKAKELCKDHGGVYLVDRLHIQVVVCNNSYNPIKSVTELDNYTIKDPKYFVKEK